MESYLVRYALDVPFELTLAPSSAAGQNEIRTSEATR